MFQYIYLRGNFNISLLFMTDKEKLRKLFHAALLAPDELPVGEPTRAVAAPEVPPARTQSPPASAPTPNDSPSPVPEAATPVVVNLGLDSASAAELAALLDEQHKRKTRKRRRETLVTLGVLFGLTGGGFGWFVHSPERVRAFQEALSDIRSVGDIQGLVGKYRAALDKVAVHSKQIDRATESIGVTSKQDGEKDRYFDKETRAMMGSEGETTGERNRALQDKFGNGKLNGGSAAHDSATPPPAGTTPAQAP